MREVATGSAQLRATVDGGIGVIVFDNPARRNALDPRHATRGRATRWPRSPTIPTCASSSSRAPGSRRSRRVPTSSSTSSRARSAATRAAYDAVLDAFWAAWDSFAKPTIAMIRGACIGGGLLVALKADIRVASDDSEFAAARGRARCRAGDVGRRRRAHRGRARLRVGAAVLGAPGLGRGRARGWGWSTGWCRVRSSKRRHSGSPRRWRRLRARRPEAAPHGDRTPRGGRERRDRTDDDAGTRAPLVAHRAEDRAADRRAPEEHHRLQRQHPPAHLRLGAELDDRGRRRHERHARRADEHREWERRRPGSARPRTAASRRRTRSTRRSPGARSRCMRRAVASAPSSEPKLSVVNNSVKLGVGAAEGARHEQREHHLEVERERAHDRDHHEGDPEVGCRGARSGSRPAPAPSRVA